MSKKEELFRTLFNKHIEENLIQEFQTEINKFKYFDQDKTELLFIYERNNESDIWNLVSGLIKITLFFFDSQEELSSFSAAENNKKEEDYIIHCTMRFINEKFKNFAKTQEFSDYQFDNLGISKELSSVLPDLKRKFNFDIDGEENVEVVVDKIDFVKTLLI